jgi:hypothetical protein
MFYKKYSRDSTWSVTISSSRHDRRSTTSYAEIRTMIIALSFGVDGVDRFNVDKLCYHHVIIVTDTRGRAHPRPASSIFY